MQCMNEPVIKLSELSIRDVVALANREEFITRTTAAV